MLTSIFPCAEYFCRCSDWSMSNLRLQRLLYFAQMISLGEHDMELFQEDFYAWNLGPINPDLYHGIKIYGAAPIKAIPDTFGIEPEGIIRSVLETTYRGFGKMTPGELILFSHWQHGAWAKNYVSHTRNRLISKTDIREEYMERQRRFEESLDATPA